MALLKAFAFLTLAVATLAAPAETGNLTRRAAPQGIDVSGWQPNINWNTVKAAGIQWVYIKVTEGTSRFSRLLRDTLSLTLVERL
jgi:GH25 family lysozyme M1 (1,4-beta-N-acetylmuramidase)